MRGTVQHYFTQAQLRRVLQTAWLVGLVQSVKRDLATLFGQCSLTTTNCLPPLPHQLITFKPHWGQNNSQLPPHLWIVIVTCHSLDRTQVNPLCLPRKLILQYIYYAQTGQTRIWTPSPVTEGAHFY